jgi:DNA-directed RNA polymerase subunit RPC12/RpoP
MNKYINGKIYKIIDNTNGNIYIGSTIKTLKRKIRMSYKCMDCISKEIIKNGDYKIELIEVYPCNNDEELRKENNIILIIINVLILEMHIQI